MTYTLPKRKMYPPSRKSPVQLCKKVDNPIVSPSENFKRRVITTRFSSSSRFQFDANIFMDDLRMSTSLVIQIIKQINHFCKNERIPCS